MKSMIEPLKTVGKIAKPAGIALAGRAAFALVGLVISTSFLGSAAMAKPSIRGLRVHEVGFDKLPDWRRDDQQQAFAAFYKSCRKLGSGSDALSKACRAAKRLPKNPSRVRARAFFESHFAPHKVRSGRRGLLTGYYEPELKGSRVRTEEYNVPLYRRPKDLVGLHSNRLRRKARRAGLSRKLTYARRTGKGSLAPYMTREQIERGGLDGRGLEIAWLADPVDAFFLHIQGSGILRLPDGSHMRIGFDGKNGYGYSSVGRALVRAGLMPASKVSLDGVKTWLRANPEQGKRAMWRNKSFIFFRELKVLRDSDGPIGAQGVSLIGGRSLAVDRRYYRLGVPIFLSVPGFKKDGRRLHRLMIAQDTGTAIKGTRRGDIFWGSGDEAGRIAGRTYHKGDFYVLLPRSTPLPFGRTLARVQKTDLYSPPSPQTTPQTTQGISNRKENKRFKPQKVKVKKIIFARSGQAKSGQPLTVGKNTVHVSRTISLDTLTQTPEGMAGRVPDMPNFHGMGAHIFSRFKTGNK